MTDKAPEDTKPQVDTKPEGEQINIKVRYFFFCYHFSYSISTII